MTVDPRRVPPAPPSPPVPQPGYSSADEAGNRQSQSISDHEGTPQQPNKRRRLKFCTVCANNQNRSMEAHLRLASADYPVLSFGTGSSVRLPGPSITKPNVYAFDTISYDAMYKELEAKDPRLYHANGVLEMLERNRNIKRRPERWQDWSVGVPRMAHGSDKGSAGVEGGVVDVVLTCEERCWEAVVEDLTNRGGRMNKPVHVINISIIDNAKEALFGGGAILDLANRLQSAAEEEERIAEEALREGRQVTEGFDEKVPEIIAEWEEKWPTLSALWTVAWF